MNRICDRCGQSTFEWTVRKWRIEVGEILSDPHWCEPCTRVVQAAIVAVLKRNTADRETP